MVEFDSAFEILKALESRGVRSIFGYTNILFQKF